MNDLNNLRAPSVLGDVLDFGLRPKVALLLADEAKDDCQREESSLHATPGSSEMIRMLDDQTLEVNLPNKFGYERIAMDCSASFARIVGFVPDRIDDLKTAVAEACLNAMEHGNRWRPEARVIVTMSFDDGTFSVSVMDEGEGVVELPEDPNIEKKIEELDPPRGLGIFLIRNLVDQVEFNKLSSQGHMLRMVIRMHY